MKKRTNHITLIILAFFFFGCSTQIDKSTNFREAQKLIDQQDYQASLKLLDIVIKNYPDFDSAYMERGFVKYCMEMYESGIEDCNKALEINYANLNAYYYRAFCFGGLGDYKSAAKDYSHIIKLGPSETYNSALFERIGIYDYWGQYDNAINDSKEILKTDSLNCEVLSGLGVLYYERKRDFEQGLHYLNQAIEKCPDYADGYYKRGNFFDFALNKNKDYNKALLNFNKAIELNPKHDNYYLSRGLVYRHMDLIDKALSDLDSAISLNPNNGFAFINRGHIKEQNLKDFKGANQDYKKAKKLGVE